MGESNTTRSGGKPHASAWRSSPYDATCGCTAYGHRQREQESGHGVSKSLGTAQGGGQRLAQVAVRHHLRVHGTCGAAGAMGSLKSRWAMADTGTGTVRSAQGAGCHDAFMPPGPQPPSCTWSEASCIRPTARTKTVVCRNCELATRVQQLMPRSCTLCAPQPGGSSPCRLPHPQQGAATQPGPSLPIALTSAPMPCSAISCSSRPTGLALTAKVCSVPGGKELDCGRERMGPWCESSEFVDGSAEGKSALEPVGAVVLQCH